MKTLDLVMWTIIVSLAALAVYSLFFGGLKMGIKAEDVVFFAILAAVLAIAFWLLHGSPALENALISFVVLIIMAEFMIWKKYFEVDKKSAVTFTKMGHTIKLINTRLENLEQGQEELLHHARRER